MGMHAQVCSSISWQQHEASHSAAPTHLLKCLDSIADVMPQVSAHTLQFLQPPQLRAQDQLTTAVGHQALNACTQDKHTI